MTASPQDGGRAARRALLIAEREAAARRRRIRGAQPRRWPVPRLADRGVPVVGGTPEVS